jgi:small subunit ribosomal protein S20
LAVKKSSAEKRHRQSEERRLRNKSVKSSVRTGVKRFVVAVQKKDQGEADVSLKDMIKLIDTAAQKGIVTKNAAARKKSRMQRLYNAFAAAR